MENYNGILDRSIMEELGEHTEEYLRLKFGVDFKDKTKYLLEHPKKKDVNFKALHPNR